MDVRARDLCSGTKYKQQTLGKRDHLLWGPHQHHSTTMAGREHSGSGTSSLCSLGFPAFSKDAASWEKSGEARLPHGREHTGPAFFLPEPPGCPHWISLHLKHVPCFLTEISGKWSLEHRLSLTQQQHLPGPIYSTCQRVSICTGRTINGGVRGEKKERIIYFRKEKIFCFFDSYLI